MKFAKETMISLISNINKDLIHTKPFKTAYKDFIKKAWKTS